MVIRSRHLAGLRARPRLFPSLPAIIGLVLLLCQPLAQVHAADETPADSTIDALSLLARIQQAAQQENYAGTFIHQQNNQVQSSRVVHMVDKAGEHEKLEMLDGQPREFIRHNDDVRCYMSDSHLILIEKRARSDSFPALLTSEPVDLDKHYQVVAERPDRVAGRIAQVVRLEARDGRRYGYRLWYDQGSHLLLKAQTIGDKGAVIEQVAFTDLAIGGAIDKSRVKPTVSRTDGWRTETSRLTSVDLAQAGWSVVDPVPGFHKVMEVRRAFGGREDIGQMVYSDGLAAISIFIESSPPPGAAEGDASKGPLNIVTRRHGNYWLTVVGDAPAAAVKQMANAIAYKAPG